MVDHATSEMTAAAKTDKRQNGKTANEERQSRPIVVDAKPTKSQTCTGQTPLCQNDGVMKTRCTYN